MGDYRTYETKYGLIDPLKCIFVSQSDSRFIWNVQDIRTVIDNLKKRGYIVEIITDGYNSGEKKILWAQPIENKYGLSNVDIASLLKESGQKVLADLKNLGVTVSVNENFIITVNKVLQSELLITAGSSFVTQLYRWICNHNECKLFSITEFLKNRS